MFYTVFKNMDLPHDNFTIYMACYIIDTANLLMEYFKICALYLCVYKTRGTQYKIYAS